MKKMLAIAMAHWLGGMPFTVEAQHSHINAGALSLEPGSKLYFVNGEAVATNSGYVVPLTLTNAGLYAGLHQGTLSFTALPATSNNGGPASGHALPGAVLQLRVETLDGPEKGAFGFWEGGDTSPRFTIKAGETSGTNAFALSESDAAEGLDPFGHVHGRRFTATVAGLYTVGFRIVDASTRGAGGAPIHQPSDLFHLHFQAGTTIWKWERRSNGMEVVFGALLRLNYFLDAADSLGETSAWRTVAGPVIGASKVAILLDNTLATSRYYRLRVERPP